MSIFSRRLFSEHVPHFAGCACALMLSLCSTVTFASVGDDSCGMYVNAFDTRSSKMQVYEAWLQGFLESKDTEYPDRHAINLWIKNYCSANPLKEVHAAAEKLNASLSSETTGEPGEDNGTVTTPPSDAVVRPAQQLDSLELECSEGFDKGRYSAALADCWEKGSGGDKDAAYNLAVIYWKGYGASIDPVLAHMWASVAYRKDHPKAGDLKTKLGQEFPYENARDGVLLFYKYINDHNDWTRRIVARNPEVADWLSDEPIVTPRSYGQTTPDTRPSSASSVSSGNYHTDHNECVKLAGSVGSGSFAFGPLWFVLPALLIQEAANAATKEAAQNKYLDCMRGRGHTNVSLPKPQPYQPPNADARPGECQTIVRGSSTWEAQGCDY